MTAKLLKLALFIPLIFLFLGGRPDGAGAQVKISAMTTGTLQDSLMFVTVWDSLGTMVSRKHYWTDLRAFFQTVSMGIDTTIAGTDLILYSQTNGRPYLLLLSDQSNGAGPQIEFFHNSASVVSADAIGQLLFYGLDDGSNRTLYADIQVNPIDDTGGSEDGALIFTVLRNATSDVRFILGDHDNDGQHDFAINTSSGDVDFRVFDDGGTLIFHTIANTGGGAGVVKFERHDDLEAPGWFNISGAAYDTLNGLEEVILMGADSLGFVWTAPHNFTSILSMDIVLSTNGSTTGDSSAWDLRWSESVYATTGGIGDIAASVMANTISDTVEHSTTAAHYQTVRITGDFTSIDALDRVRWRLVRDRSIANDESNLMVFHGVVVQWN